MCHDAASCVYSPLVCEGNVKEETFSAVRTSQLYTQFCCYRCIALGFN